MKALVEHLKLRNPSFVCRDVDRQADLIVTLKSKVGRPATALQLKTLKKLAGPEYEGLAPFR